MDDASGEAIERYDTRKFPLGTLSQRSMRVIEEGSDPKARFETLADAYYSYALMATFVFGFSIAVFNSDVGELSNDTIHGVYGILLTCATIFAGYVMVLFGVEYYMYKILLGRRDYNALVDIKQYNFLFVNIGEYALWVAVYCLLFASTLRCLSFPQPYASIMATILTSTFLLLIIYALRTSIRFGKYRRDKL